MLVKQKGKLFRLRNSKAFKFVYVYGKGISLFTRTSFHKGEEVMSLSGKPVPSRTATAEAVQLNEDFFLDTKYLVEGDFVNHSCDPNTRIDMEQRRFVAVKDIPSNSEVTYNYLTTEWDMEEFGTAFQCRCGSSSCLGRIQGFRYLTERQKESLKPLLSPFLRSKSM